MNKLLKNIIAFSLKNRYFIFFCAGLLLISGIITFKNMPIEAFQDVTNTEISIITKGTGGSAEEIEKFVTIPIEIAMNPVQQKISLRSSSIFGLSVVKLIFSDRVIDRDARNQVNSVVAKINLPDGIQPQVQPPTGPTGEIFRYTLKSDFRDDRELKTIQDWVIDRQLRAVPGVADIVSFGGRVKTYEIQVDPGKLTNLGITPLDVYSAVQKSNINIGGDFIVRNNQAYVVRGIGLLNDIGEIRNIIVTNTNDIPVLIKDVADVQISNVPRLGHVGRADPIVDSSAHPVLDPLGHSTIVDQDDVVEAIIIMRTADNPRKSDQSLQP